MLTIINYQLSIVNCPRRLEYLLDQRIACFPLGLSVAAVIQFDPDDRPLKSISHQSLVEGIQDLGGLIGHALFGEVEQPGGGNIRPNLGV